MITSKTEQAVCDAYIELMEEKRYDEIRAKDLIARAGIGRSTFYDHFDSPDAVLEMIERDLYETFPDGALAISDTAAPESVRETSVRLACRHLQQNVKTYRALCGPNGDYAFQALMEKRNQQVMESLLARTETKRSNAEVQVIIQAMAGMQWYVLKCWALHADEVSVTELATMLYRIQGAICAQLT